jgi:hypothetical protein
MATKRIFISADHGMAIVYFLQSDVVPTILNSGIDVVLLTDEGLRDQIIKRFGRNGLEVEGLRLGQARKYFNEVSSTEQWWLNFLRRVGGSKRINMEAMESHVQQVDYEAVGKRRMLMSFMKSIVGLLRRSKIARKAIVSRQMRYSPDLYTDLFDQYKPNLVVASTPGWRLDRYLMRQAVKREIPTAAVIVGWDNPSSYSIPGAPVDWITCWSDLQKEELVLGSDWDPDKVHIGGIPSYDGYYQKRWLMGRDDYYKLHGLNPKRKLISYACSFITFSPNYQNIEMLAGLVASNELNEHGQLLVRLHPNHFLDEPLFAGEREQIQALADRMPHVHLVEPVPLGGELGHYSGEDMPEKTSMMAHSDVFTTVYSTMVVEAAVHDRPIISVCIDAPGGWNQKGKFSLPLSKIGDWPTHQRFRESGAGMVAADRRELLKALNFYLDNPNAHQKQRRSFIEEECTFMDASAGKRTGEYLVSLIDKET